MLMLKDPARASTRLEDFFRIWTFKEAYTKALGLGLGFDFARVAYDVRGHTFTVDGQPEPGWDIRVFKVEGVVDGTYVGAVARLSESTALPESVIRDIGADAEGGLLVRFDAEDFVKDAITLLGSMI
jgi:4'-phosphopantetheinyl transferase